MEDYPRNLNELEARFSSETACREYLFKLRWPDGFRCPRCGGAKGWPLRSVLMECGECRYQTSVTAGTIFQDTRKPLALWFRMMWWVTSQKNGADSEFACPSQNLPKLFWTRVRISRFGYPFLDSAIVWPRLHRVG